MFDTILNMLLGRHIGLLPEKVLNFHNSYFLNTYDVARPTVKLPELAKDLIESSRNQPKIKQEAIKFCLKILRERIGRLI